MTVFCWLHASMRLFVLKRHSNDACHFDFWSTPSQQTVHSQIIKSRCTWILIHTVNIILTLIMISSTSLAATQLNRTNFCKRLQTCRTSSLRY